MNHRCGLTVKLKFVVMLFTLLGVWGMTTAVYADDSSPIWTAGNGMHIELLGVQWSMAKQDPDEAQTHLSAARVHFEQVLRPLMQPEIPALVTMIDADYATLHDQITGGDEAQVAQSIGSLWTHFLNAVTQMTLLTIQREDGRAALDWLLLREPRPATSTVPARVDAAAEVYALIGERRDLQDVYDGVQAELYDTYQERLNDALTEGDAAATRPVRAQQAALAAGYFGIIAGRYGQQFGQAALADLQTRFGALVQAAASADEAAYKTARQSIVDGLNGFVAAPMTDLELSRIAGLMMRYLTLIPVEYDKSVSDGAVTNETDYQQAVDYLQQARLSYAQLRGTLEANLSDTDKQALTEQFQQLNTQMQAYEAAPTVQASAFTLTQAVGDMLPVKWRSINSTSDIQAIRVVLQQVRVNVRSGEYEAALASCVGAYSVLQQTLGQKLLAFAPDIALKLDTLLWQGEPGQPGLAVLIASGASVGTIEQEIARLDAVLDEAEFTLSSKSSPAVVLTNTAVIVFREGLEAILILVALLGNLWAASARRIRYALLGGAVLAGVLAALSGWLVSRVLNAFASQQNQLVAIISLAAVLVMLYIMNWFVHRIYWTQQLATLHARKAETLALGGTAGILTLGFVSVYREAFETALFLQPLALTAGDGLMLVGLGIGLVALFLVALLIMALNKRLPYKTMLIFTGVLMLVVLVGMVGKTVYAFQIVSWLPITPMGLVFIPKWLEDWFGVYPTWQGIILQITAAVFVVGSYFWIERRRKQRRNYPPSAG